MRVLVTGAAGYIGGAVIDRLLQNGDEPYAVDNLLYSDSFNRFGVKFFPYDIRSSAFIDLLLKYKFDAVIHLAAIVGDAACKVDEKLTMDVNYWATDSIASNIHFKLPDTKLIYASTCSVFGASAGLLNENSATNPLSSYAKSKLMGEKPVLGCKNSIIFRLGTLFGLSTEHARIRNDLVANVLTLNAVENKDIKVFGGEQWRPLIHVRDVARILADSVHSKITGTYILSHANWTISGLAEEIVRTTNSHSKIIKENIPFEDFRNYMVDNRKSLDVGVSYRFSVKDGVTEMANVTKTHIKNPWSSKYHNAKYLEELYKNGHK